MRIAELAVSQLSSRSGRAPNEENDAGLFHITADRDTPYPPADLPADQFVM